MRRLRNKYIICVLMMLVLLLSMTACGGQDAAVETKEVETKSEQWQQMEPTGKMNLKYAKEYTVDYYEDDLSLVTIGGSDRFLVVPEGGKTPEGLDADIVVLQQPFEDIYLVSSSVMDFFRALDGLDSIRLSGLEAEKWYIPEAKEAMENEEILYAGKYNVPDYEVILEESCDLAIENTNIYHNPEVQEELESLGIPVLVEKSSFETHPLGRMEWLKLYGLLLDKNEEAEKLFEAETAKLNEIVKDENTGKSVSYFYVLPSGTVNVRKPGDYISKMIEMAGGRYIFEDLKVEEENALATLTMQMEDFYAGARDADFIIYNSTKDAELYTVEELLNKSELLADFKAVKEGNVWGTGKNFFQESMGMADFIVDVHTILNEGAEAPDELKFIHRLK